MAGELPADVLEDMMIAEVVGNEVQAQEYAWSNANSIRRLHRRGK